LLKVIDVILKIIDQNEDEERQIKQIILYLKNATEYALDTYEEVDDWEKWGDDIFLVKTAKLNAHANDDNINELLKLLSELNSKKLNLFTYLVADLLNNYYLYSDYSVYDKTTSSTHGSLFKRTTKRLLESMTSFNSFKIYLNKLRNKMISGINYTEDLFGKNPKKRSSGVRRFTNASVAISEAFLKMFKKDQSGMLLFSFEPDGFCSSCAWG